jgi:hypothetical protein
MELRDGIYQRPFPESIDFIRQKVGLFFYSVETNENLKDQFGIEGSH